MDPFAVAALGGLVLLVLFPPLILTRPVGEALTHWFTHTPLWEVGAATALGLAVGWGAGRALWAGEASDLIEDDWRLVYTVALSLLAVGWPTATSCWSRSRPGRRSFRSSATRSGRARSTGRRP